MKCCAISNKRQSGLEWIESHLRGLYWNKGAVDGMIYCTFVRFTSCELARKSTLVTCVDVSVLETNNSCLKKDSETFTYSSMVHKTRLQNFHILYGLHVYKTDSKTRSFSKVLLNCD